jgi:hypothetical protein
MNRRHVKTFVATFLASMMLYYSAAWAVLRCCHDDEHAGVMESISKDGMHDGLDADISRPSGPPAQVDCLDFDFQTEVLAIPTPAPELHRVSIAVTPSSFHLNALKSLADDHRKDLLRYVFTRGSPSESSAPPLYLSLATLRI